jgi:hypothetical protein
VESVVRFLVSCCVPELKLARVVPEEIVNVTAFWNAGAPAESRTVTLTVPWFAIAIESGVTATAILAGVGGGGVPTCRVALLFSGPAATLTSTIAFPALAV